VPKVQPIIKHVDKPVIRTIENVIEIPKFEYVDKIIERPMKKKVQKFVEVPQIKYLDKIVDIPKITTREIIIEVPKETHVDVEEEAIEVNVDLGIEQQEAETERETIMIEGEELPAIVSGTTHHWESHMQLGVPDLLNTMQLQDLAQVNKANFPGAQDLLASRRELADSAQQGPDYNPGELQAHVFQLAEDAARRQAQFSQSAQAHTLFSAPKPIEFHYKPMAFQPLDMFAAQGASINQQTSELQGNRNNAGAEGYEPALKLDRELRVAPVGGGGVQQ